MNAYKFSYTCGQRWLEIFNNKIARDEKTAFKYAFGCSRKKNQDSYTTRRGLRIILNKVECHEVSEVFELAHYRKKNLPKKCPIMETGCSSPCVDHNHDTGMVRGVVSMEGNTFLGRVENSFKRFGTASTAGLPKILRNMADYIEKGDTEYLHPVDFASACI